MSEPGERSTPRTLPEKIDYLIRHVHPRDRKPYTHPEIAEATGLSTGLLSALRSGKNTNPTKDTLERLARFFGVSEAFFFTSSATSCAATSSPNPRPDVLAALVPQLDPAVVRLMLARRHTLRHQNGLNQQND